MKQRLFNAEQIGDNIGQGYLQSNQRRK
jgi:hypothetical protein